ncbi:MAG: hypothetical protein HUK13_03060 [Muribaculaceae bacterium]|nr:hypothetical protein [Muribaculaceae bacterium]
MIVPGSGKVSATNGQPTTSSDLMLVKYTPTPTSIETITVEQETGVTYNLLGIPVGDDYKGFVIRDGKKYLRR